MNPNDPRAAEPTAEDAAMARLAATTPVASASSGAREAARTAFLEGRRPAVDAPATRRATVRPPRWLPLAAAAAAAITVFWFGFRPTDEWRVAKIEGAGLATANGETLAAGASFDAGLVTVAADSELHLVLGDRLCVCLPAGSRVRVPEGPTRFGGGPRRLEVEVGDLFASSGERSLGFDLDVATDDATVRVVGTTFAVQVNDDGTCVCLYAGDVAVDPATGGEPRRVPVGRRLHVLADGRDPATSPLDPAEAATLAAIHESGVALAGDDPPRY